MQLYYIGIIVGFLLGGCASLRVVSDYDRHFDFTASTRVDVAYVAQDDGENVVREHFVKQLKKALQQRGFSIVGKEKADMHVKVYLSLLQKRRAETSYDYVPAAFAGYYRPSYFNRPFLQMPYRQHYCAQGIVYRTYTVHEYDEQHVVIEMSDAKSQNIVWHAIADDTFSNGDSKRYTIEYIEKVVHEVLLGFPPHQIGENDG